MNQEPDFEMSDEDFMNSAALEEAPTAQETVANEPAPKEDIEDPSVDPEEAGAGTPGAAAETVPEDVEPEGDAYSSVPEDDTSSQTGTDAASPASTDAASGDDSEQVEANNSTSQQAEEIDFKASYEKMMGTFKANGRDFTPRSPDEVIQLMQKGADYSKKMNAMKPHMKMLRTLQEHDLLNEDKINHLVDLASKKPEAIQKLLSDGNIDPLDLDTSKAADYRPGNHIISDKQNDFQTALDDILASDGGAETVSEISKNWDAASQNLLQEDPQLFHAIHSQRANGIYGQISAEIEREKMLGNLQNVPFLQAYKAVGDKLQAQGAFNHVSAGAGNEPKPVVLETRPAKPKAAAANATQARAAGATRQTPQAPVQQFDPLAMSDDEFLAATSTHF